MSRFMDSLRLRLRALFRRSRVEAEMGEELSFHLEQQIAENRAAGMSPEEARLAALRSFGGVEQVKEEARDARGLVWLESFLQDIRFALRGLRRNPGFAAATVFTLALGIGANTAIFGLLDSILFRPLPVREPERLYRIVSFEPAGGRGISYTSLSYLVYRELREGAASFEGIGAHTSNTPVHLSFKTGAAERVSSALVSGNLFDLLGVAPAAGRLVVPADDLPGAPPVIVLSHAYWSRRFQRDPAVIGSTVVLNGTPATVVGVTPPAFSGLDLAAPGDVFLPVSLSNVTNPFLAEALGGDLLKSRGFAYLEVTGRLKRSMTLEQASAEMAALARNSEYLHSADRSRIRDLRLLPEAQVAVDAEGDGRTQGLAWLLFGTVCLVLLLACADVAGLLSVRAERRQHELAVRLALGSSRRRLARQLLVESLVLSAIALGLSLAFAVWMATALAALTPANFPLPLRSSGEGLNARVLVFAALLAAGSALLFSLLPAWRAARKQPVDALKRDARSGGARLAPATRLFVVFEIALCVVLLVGSGLLLHSVWRITRVQPGFESAGRFVGQIDVARHGYRRERGVQFYSELLERLRNTPGVRAAAFGSRVPMGRGNMMTSVEPEGHERNDERFAELMGVSPGYFQALGIPLLAGRDFSGEETLQQRDVLIVNRSFADKYWPGQDPIGKRLMNFGEHGGVIIGVVGDIRNAALRQAPLDTVYASFGQMYTGGVSIVIHAENAATASGLISRAAAQLDPTLPVFNERPLAANLADSLGAERLIAVLLTAFGALALVLATTGVYSLASMAAQLRTREFGIRVALGAQRGDILRLVLGQTLILLVAGLGMGLAASFYAARSLQAMLYEVRTTDPATLAAVVLVLLAAGLLAGYFPGRRATRVDPVVALRYE